MKNDIKIKKATVKDTDAISVLIKPMWLEHPANEPEILDKKYLQKVDVAEYLSKYWNSNDNAAFVAEVNNKIVGCCTVKIKKIEGMFTTDRVAYVDDLVVEDKYQKQGIAMRIINSAEEFARDKGVKLMQTRIYNFNKIAQALFKNREYKNIYSEWYKPLR